MDMTDRWADKQNKNKNNNTKIIGVGVRATWRRAWIKHNKNL